MKVPGIPHETPPGARLPTRLRVRARDATERALDYLGSRQSANGGFCFYRWHGVEEPNLHDTWHALAAFTLLGAKIPRAEDAASFVMAFLVGGFEDVYRLAFALDLLGAGSSLAQDLRRRILGFDASVPLANERVPIAGRLRHALRIVGLQQRFGSIVSPQAVAARVDLLQHDGGWGDKPNLGDTWPALSILDACGRHGFDDPTRHFVDALQAASFGFTATLDSTYADLGTVHAGACACFTLGLPIRHAADAVDFVLACQSDAGGFARTPDALPDIAWTHQALRALVATGAFASHDVAWLRRDGDC